MVFMLIDMVTRFEVVDAELALSNSHYHAFRAAKLRSRRGGRRDSPQGQFGIEVVSITVLISEPGINQPKDAASVCENRPG